MLAGLLSGGLTASTAFSSDPPTTPDPTPAVAAPASAAAPPPAPADAQPSGAVDVNAVAALRVQESAIAEWEYRRNLPVAASRSTTTPGSLVRPARGAMTGWFGEARGSHRHAGTDFDGNTGDPVVAAGSGTVTHAGRAPAGYAGYGQVVLIDHGSGVTTLYAHLSRIRVAGGQTVAAGDLVGAIGTTGSVTGSHLHFEVRVGGRAVNPAHWIAG